MERHLERFLLQTLEAYWKTLKDQLEGKPEVILDYYAMEEPWTLDKTPYSSVPEGDAINVAKEVFEKTFK